MSVREGDGCDGHEGSLEGTQAHRAAAATIPSLPPATFTIVRCGTGSCTHGLSDQVSATNDGGPESAHQDESIDPQHPRSIT